MKIRVLQGHSICYRDIWFNQGDTLDVDAGAEFTANRAKYDAEGKYLGQEIISQTETISEATASTKEEE